MPPFLAERRRRTPRHRRASASTSSVSGRVEPSSQMHSSQSGYTCWRTESIVRRSHAGLVSKTGVTTLMRGRTGQAAMSSLSAREIVLARGVPRKPRAVARVVVFAPLLGRGAPDEPGRSER